MEYTDEQRLRKLENRVAALEQAIGSRTPGSLPHGESNAVYAQASSESDAVNHFFAWLQNNWLMKLGAFLVLLAFAWFVRYAFAENWIGPMGRISLGFITGAAILFFGHFWMLKKRVPGQVLIATGATMILLTIFAARNVYDFFTPESAIVMTSVVIILVAVSSVIRNSLALAILAFLGGAIAPLLVNAPETNYVSLMSYVFLLDLGVLAIVAFRGWRVLIFLGLIATAVYSAITFDSMSYKVGESVVQAFMALFYSVFFVGNSLAIVKTKTVKVIDLFTIGANSLIFLVWTTQYIPEEWRSSILAFVGLISVIVAFYFLSQGKAGRDAMFLHASSAALFLGAATASELHGAALIIAFSFEAVLFVALSAFVIRSQPATKGTSFLLFMPLFMAFFDNYFFLDQWIGSPLFGKNLAVVTIITFSFASTAFILNKISKEYSGVKLLQIITASLSGIMLVWLSLHSLLETQSTARGVALVIYSAIGVILFFRGTKEGAKSYRIAGEILFGCVVLRLLLVEVWAMPLAGRVITFVLVGILLIATAFLERRSHH
jgi:hypothetical protein